MRKRIICIMLIALMFMSFFPSQALASQSTVVKFSVKKDGNVSLSKNFKVKEFACKDGSDEVYIDLELVAILQNIRDHFGKSVTINSGYRTSSHNKKVGGASNSYHVKGMAADIVVSGVKPAEVAKYAETIGVRGVGKYSTFVHVDSRPSKYYWDNTSGSQKTVKTHGGNYKSQPYKFDVNDFNIDVTDSSLNISMRAYPKSLTKGKSFNLEGTVSSNQKISSVVGYILDASGKEVQKVTVKPNAYTLDIKSSDVNYDLKFGKLSDGTYTLRIVATDSVKSVEWKKTFTVGNTTHTHSYKDVGCSSEHPHYSLQQCSCGAEKTGSESKFTTTDVKVSESSCSETGLIEKRCDICGYVISKTEIPKTAHTIVIVSGKDATCTESGIGHGEYCSVCNEILATGAVLPAKGHSGKLVGFIEATKDSEGYTGDVVCETCGEILEKGMNIPVIETEIKPFVGDMMLTLEDQSGNTYYYHIPQVYLEGDKARDANKKIYNELISYFETDESWIAEGYDELMYENLTYGVSQKNDVVSIVTKTNEYHRNYFEYKAYNISSATGNIIDDSYVISLFGFKEDKLYYDLLRTKFEEAFVKENGTQEDYNAEIGNDYYDRQLNWTLSDENLKNTVPFINDKGELCIVAHIGAISGEDWDTHIVNITGTTISEPEFAYEEIPDIMIKEYIPEDTPVRPEDTVKCTIGDVNNDGTVDAKDATQILRFCNGKVSALANATIEQEYAADVNDDGGIDAKDATQILRHVNGKTSAFDSL